MRQADAVCIGIVQRGQGLSQAACLVTHFSTLQTDEQRRLAACSQTELSNNSRPHDAAQMPARS